MHLAFVNSTRRWGGVKSWCLDMGRCALARGHGVFVYGRDARFIQATRDAGMVSRQVAFGPDFYPPRIADFFQDFRQHKISHVIVNVGKDLRSAGVAARLAGLPTVVHVGAPADFTDTRLRRLVHRWIKPAYVCCSAFTCNRILADISWLHDAMVTVIHPGTAMPDESPRLSRPPYTLIATSQLTPPKRHEDLIRACALLRDEGYDFQLKIVGAGECEEALRTLVTALNLEKIVEFRGYVSCVADELRQADIFILPTQAEPLGIALEEAMAYGLFPLARNDGGVPEIWPDEFRSALLPPSAGPTEFAAGLRLLLALPPEELARRRRIVQNHARATFGCEKQFLELESFLNVL